MACPPAAAGAPSPLQPATAQRESGPVQRRAGATMKLQSSEGQIFEADLQTVMFSGTLRTMMEGGLEIQWLCAGLSRACPAAAEADDEVVPLVTVSAAVLQKVLQWLTYHKHELRLIAEEEAAGVPASRHLLASPWDTHFFSVDQDTLFQIIKKVLQWLTYHKHELAAHRREEAAGVPRQPPPARSPGTQHFFSVDQDTLSRSSRSKAKGRFQPFSARRANLAFARECRLCPGERCQHGCTVRVIVGTAPDPERGNTLCDSYAPQPLHRTPEPRSVPRPVPFACPLGVTVHSVSRLHLICAACMEAKARDSRRSNVAADVVRAKRSVRVLRRRCVACVQAADYLDIGALMDAGCKAVANMMRGKTPDEIRRKLCMRNDFTPAQEEHVRECVYRRVPREAMPTI
ncbi:hypothetical protein HPB48_008889 [Haemaphysalis longicornis]|uniref:SKP1 component dimerisation domain-containing protein n=1 Tax=Haemaphysalis longicornis TaxID=44386 RepID=A0A9J6H110_HAELO|nr:hypothetical protein HPB48_008889 [Haemaphysalis longicornis]